VITKADFKADVSPHFTLEFFGDACCHAARGNTPWLGMANKAVDTSASFKAELGELGGFSGTRFPADNYHLVVADGLDDVITLFTNRQSRVCQWWQPVMTLLGFFNGGINFKLKGIQVRRGFCSQFVQPV
jgi:hypothetical protein